MSEGESGVEVAEDDFSTADDYHQHASSSHYQEEFQTTTTASDHFENDSLSSDESDGYRENDSDLYVGVLWRPVTGETHKRFRIFACVVLYATAFTFAFHTRSVQALAVGLQEPHGLIPSSWSHALFPVSCFFTAYLGHTFLRETTTSTYRSLLFSFALFVTTGLIWFSVQFRQALEAYEEEIDQCQMSSLKGTWIDKSLCFCSCSTLSTTTPPTAATGYCVIAPISEEACSTFQDRLHDKIEGLSALEMPALLVILFYAMVFLALSFAPKASIDGQRESVMDGDRFIYNSLPLNEDENERRIDDQNDDVEGYDDLTAREMERDSRDSGIEMGSVGFREYAVLARADATIVGVDSHQGYDNRASGGGDRSCSPPVVVVDVIGHVYDV